MYAKTKVTAKLSDLAKIPYSVLEQQRDVAHGDDKKKLQQAMNLRMMRTMSNNHKSMFGMRNY
jgi:hypothetical protein